MFTDWVCLSVGSSSRIDTEVLYKNSLTIKAFPKGWKYLEKGCFFFLRLDSTDIFQIAPVKLLTSSEEGVELVHCFLIHPFKRVEESLVPQNQEVQKPFNLAAVYDTTRSKNLTFVTLGSLLQRPRPDEFIVT